MNDPLTRALAPHRLLGVAALLLTSITAHGQTLGSFSVSVQTDAFQAIPSPLVTIGQDGWAIQLSGNSEGHTSGVSLDLDDFVTVRLDEVTLTTLNGNLDAVSIGQQFTMRPSDMAGGSDGFRLYYFQPVARSLQFSGPSYGAISDQESGWSASAGQASFFAFDAYAAELPVKEVVSNYFAYKTGHHTTQYENGVLIRVDDAVDLGDGGMTIAIDLAGYNYGGPPAVTTLAMDNPTMQSSLFPFIRSINDEFIQIQVAGVLSPGDNLILLSGATGGSIWPAENIYITAVGDPGGSCQPGPPTCSTPGQCPPPLPTGAVLGGSTTCTDKSLKVGNVVCAPAGAAVSSTECTGYMGGWSIRALLGIPKVGEIEVSASGEISGSVCTTVTALPGNCAQGYKCYKECKRTWECSYYPWYSFFPKEFMQDTFCGINGATTASSCSY